MDDSDKKSEPGQGVSWQFQPNDTNTPEPATNTVVTSEADTSPTPQAVEPAAVAVPPEGPEGSISWTASEFIAHHKSAGWYLMLAVVTLAVAGLIWLLTKDVITAIVVVVGAVLFGIYAARKPRQLQYRLDGSGLSIGERYFPYENFRSFAIMPEGAFMSIAFLPLKRFSPLTTIYYDPADEAKIIALLSDRLPLEEHSHDLLDRLMWRIRF